MSTNKGINSHRLYHTKLSKSSVSSTLPNKEQIDKLGMLALKRGYTAQQFSTFINPKYGQFTIVDARHLWSHLKGMEADNE